MSEPSSANVIFSIIPLLISTVPPFSKPIWFTVALLIINEPPPPAYPDIHSYCPLFIVQLPPIILFIILLLEIRFPEVSYCRTYITSRNR